MKIYFFSNKKPNYTPHKENKYKDRTNVIDVEN